MATECAGNGAKGAGGWTFGDECCWKRRQGCRRMDLWRRKCQEMAPGVPADGPLAMNAGGNGARGAGGCTFGDESCRIRRQGCRRMDLWRRKLQESAVKRQSRSCYARQDAGIRVYQLIVRVYTLPNRSLTDTVPEPVAGACTRNRELRFPVMETLYELSPFMVGLLFL